MSAYIVRRLALFVPTLFIVSIVTFLVLRAIPGDAVLAQLEDLTGVTPETLAARRAELGLDEPMVVQYVKWLSDLAQGDLGTSFVGNREIGSELLRRLPYTVELAVIALGVSILIGVPFGVMCALFRNGPVDYALRTVAVLWLAVPSFWLATMVLVLPTVWFGWSPSLVVSKFTNAPGQHLIDMGIPGIIMGLHVSAVTIRMTRSQFLEVMNQDYIRTAYAKGLSTMRVASRHALKNALIPVVTIWGGQIAALLGGSVIMEFIFGIPGLGSWTLNSIRSRDFPVVQTLVLFFATSTLVINLLVDISYPLLDPRIKAGARSRV